MEYHGKSLALVSLIVSFPSDKSYTYVLQFSPDPDAALDQWKELRSGPMTEYGRMQIIWARIPQNATIWKNHSDPSSGKNAPHIELYFYVRASTWPPCFGAG